MLKSVARNRQGDLKSACSDLTLTLERFVGDVLIAHCLVGHSVCGFIEVGSFGTKWATDIFEELNSCRATVWTFYEAIVFLQSSLLRAAPFTAAQKYILGIHSAVDDEKAMDKDAMNTLIMPAAPFIGSLNKKLLDVSCLLALTTITMTVNEFGHLGPTFRGRDHISSQTISPSSLLASFNTFADMTPFAMSIAPNVGLLAPFMHEWQDGTNNSVRWMLNTHSEALFGQRRPMTVMPPTITVKVNSNIVASISTFME